MAAPMKGIFAARYAQPYTGALGWGTGINPVHSYYGSPGDRLLPVSPMQGLDQPNHAVTAPYEATPQREREAYEWGYQPEDSTYTTLQTDDRPTWDVPTPDSPVRFSTQGQPPYDATGAAKSRFRDTMAGAFQTWRGKLPRADYRVPSETVSEGWTNKGPHGEAANAKPSDPGQYEIQTSMTQRYQTRVNDHSVQRGTDEPRAPISSLVTGQKIKYYSGGERHYDMYPRQQTPERERDFFYRTAGTGEPAWMQDNEQWDIVGMERTPPPDPYVGGPDTSDQLQFGYTGEDYFYA